MNKKYGVWAAFCVEKAEHDGKELRLGSPKSTSAAADAAGREHSKLTGGHRWRVEAFPLAKREIVDFGTIWCLAHDRTEIEAKVTGVGTSRVPGSNQAQLVPASPLTIRTTPDGWGGSDLRCLNGNGEPVKLRVIYRFSPYAIQDATFVFEMQHPNGYNGQGASAVLLTPEGPKTYTLEPVRSEDPPGYYKWRFIFPRTP